MKDGLINWLAALLKWYWRKNEVFPPMTQLPLMGQGLLIIEASRSDTPQSVCLLFTMDWPDAKTTHNTHNSKTSMNPEGFEPGGIRTRNPNKQAAADPRLRPRGHWDRCGNWSTRSKKKNLSYYHGFVIKVTWDVLGSRGRQLTSLNLERTPHQLMHKEVHTSRGSVSPYAVWIPFPTLNLVPVSVVR